MENNAANFLILSNEKKPPEGYFLSTLSQAKENIKSVTKALSAADVEKDENIRLKNGVINRKENKELLMECSYPTKLKYKLVSNSKLGKELPKEDCPVALVYAAANDDEELVKEVVECAGPDILSKSFGLADSGTILHVCTQWGSVNTLQKVLKEYPHECNLYSVDIDGDTALHNLSDYCRYTAESYRGCYRAALLLLGFATVNANELLGVQNCEPHRMTALCKALVYEMPEACAALLNAARAIEGRPGQTSQKSATSESHWLSVKAYGEEVGAVYRSGGKEIGAVSRNDGDEDDEDEGPFCTALHLAVRLGYGYIVTKILQHPGAENLNLASLKDSNGNTPLHVAAMVGNVKICAAILKDGILESDKAGSGGVRFLNKGGETPLHIAAAQGHAEVCEMLLYSGVPLSVRDVDGRYALTNAFHESHLRAVDIILNYCILNTSRPGRRGREKSKAANKVDINERLEFGLTLLHVAAAISSFLDVKWLVHAGADINCTCNDHTTPLHRAVGKGIRISEKTLTSDYEESSDEGCPMKESGEFTQEAIHPRKLEEKSSDTTKVLVTDAESSDSTSVKESSEATKEAKNPRKDEENITSAVIREISSEITLKETTTNEESSDEDEGCTGADTEEANDPEIQEESTDTDEQKKRCGIVSFLLHKGARVDLQDSKGETPLHYAAQYDCRVLNSLLTKKKEPQNFEKGRTQDEWICMCNFAGQTALHQLAARVDDPSIEASVELLLKTTSNSQQDLLRIRDMEKMTALDVAAQNAQYKAKLIEKMMANSDEITKGFLMLSLREHGQVEDADTYCGRYKVKVSKSSLLKAAVDEADVDIARELVNSGADVTALNDDGRTWLVTNLCKAASDQPTLEDTLGRTKLVKAVATLLLNPYTETPVTIGVFGSWGAGKSSFMRQVEEAMLSMSVKEIFRKTHCSPSLDKESSLTKFSRGGICLRSMVLNALEQRAKKVNKSKHEVDKKSQNFSRGGNYLHSMVLHALKQCKTKANKFEDIAHKEAQIEDDIIFKFPMELQTKYHQLFRSLALIDRSKLVQSSLRTRYKGTALHDADFIAYTPAVLTVHYNAWRYDNKIEASAGLVIEISKQLESFMTPSQWLRMCWKNSWKSHPREFLSYFIFPTLISVFVVCFILFVWRFVPIATRYKAISLPMGIASAILPIIKACLGATQPVTKKLLDLTKSFDHQSMLGYQHQVIDDINFLKDQLCEDAHFFWIVLGFFCKPFIPNTYFMEGTWIWRQYPCSSNFRILAFIDDLDRCDEKIILELLRAINVILGSCGINVVIGVDKDMLHLAITREFLKNPSDNIFDFWADSKAFSTETNTQGLENADGKATLEPEDSKSEEKRKKNSANVDKNTLLCEFADKYLQKIIHLPIQMPEPSKKHIEKFLEGQVGQRSTRSKKKQKDESKIKKPGEKKERCKDDPELIEIVTVGERIKDEKKQMKADGYSQTQVINKVNEEVCESEDGANEPIVYDLLLANYTSLEKDTIKYLCQFTTKERDLPREWKRFLNYHRLAWTILSQDRTMKKEEYKGWQRKLIIWIFICWNWRSQMDDIFKKWHEIISKMPKRQAKLQWQDIKPNDGASMKLFNIIDTYTNIMEGNTNKQPSKNMGKQEDEVVSKDWKDLQLFIKNKHDIPLKLVRKFQQFRFYCVLNHLEINE